MYSISRLQALMKGLPQSSFKRLVQEKGADKYSKGFGCWNQLVAMLYAQWAGVGSLRELELGFNGQHRHHYHLGVKAIRRSTLSDANRTRRAEVYAETARSLMIQVGRAVRREGQELLYLLDSTSITLKGPGFDEWTHANRTRHTQGLKLHVLYEAGQAIPCHHSFSAANVNDIDEGRKLPLEAGALYVFDKGYCDYNWWAEIDRQQARFVTRFKHNAALTVERALPVPMEHADTILEDHIVRFRYKHPGGQRRNHYEKPLRKIVVTRPDKPTPLVLASNDLHSPAAELAQRYKDRWQIELFFKWIKQHLRIKRFLGRSENSVRIQILTALIAYLLLSLYQKQHGLKRSLWHTLAEIRVNLFQRPATDAAIVERRRQLQELELRQGRLF